MKVKFRINVHHRKYKPQFYPRNSQVSILIFVLFSAVERILLFSLRRDTSLAGLISREKD